MVARVVRRDPFAAVPTTARLMLAAILACLTPTADEFSQTFGYLLPGGTLYGDCGYSDQVYCTPDVTLPGTYVPGSINYTTHAQLRFVVWAAALTLVVVAVSRRTAQTRRLARLATAGLAFALAFSFSLRAPLAVLLVVLALLLAVPPAWRRLPPGPAVFGAAAIRR